ncbi:hypothetical protein Tco_1021415 [Tanacetum coccineum]
MPCLGDTSWGWRKLLQIRPHVHPFIWHKINNGRSTSMWFDRWADPCSLRDMITVRNIVCSGFSLSSTVSDLISNGSWRWPHDWSFRFLNVFNILVPDINSDLDDVIVWHDIRGVRALTGMSSVPPRLVDVLAFLIPSKGSLVSNVISRLVLAAMTYCLWNERNLRLFEEVECGSYYSIYYFFGADEACYFQVQEDGYRGVVFHIVGVGEREDDSFLIINLSAKVVQYNLISKTLPEIYDMGSNAIADDYLHGFIPPYAMYDVGYKKLDYKVFDFILSSARV